MIITPMIIMMGTRMRAATRRCMRMTVPDIGMARRGVRLQGFAPSSRCLDCSG
ncbi:MAG: hypothetical protein J0L51_08015 [Rhizobiales bacterium]|nr:hypothetical protein [Hyphomicrobiales bacterium]